jgi:NADH dehydrogenase/NADH:ubiquinone oxidoreductase subunit G
MPRKGQIKVREVSPDPKFHDRTVAKFIVTVMERGKKSLAERIFYGALDEVADVVLPTAVPAEKQGSFTNTNGLKQHFERALKPSRVRRAEGAILAGLAAGLNVKLD